MSVSQKFYGRVPRHQCVKLWRPSKCFVKKVDRAYTQTETVTLSAVCMNLHFVFDCLV